MNLLTQLSEQAFNMDRWMETIGWTLLYGSCQICVVALLFFLGRALLRWSFPKRQSAAVYNLACACLLMSLLLPIGTFAYLNSTIEQAEVSIAEVEPEFTSPSIEFSVAELASESSAIGIDSSLPNFESDVATEQDQTFVTKKIASHFYWIVPLWLVGVMLLSLRPILGLWNVHRLRTRGLSELPQPILKIGKRIANQIGISRTVQFAQSALVQVPTVIGIFKPVVLLPVSVTTGLSMTQIEQILAHELAHIRRHDYIVNLFQSFVETIFFFHPCVWWMSRQIRNERENCCDDIAVEQAGDPVVYVSALMSLEKLRATAPPALSANGASLINRVCRLLGEPRPTHRANWLSISFSSAIVLALAITIVVATGSPNSASEVSPATLSHNIEVAQDQEPEGTESNSQAKPNGDSPTEDGSDPIVATVNGLEIRASVPANLCYLQYRERTLSRLIDQLLVKEELKEANLFPVPPEELQKTAAKIGMTEERYTQLLLEKGNITSAELELIFATKKWIKQNGLTEPKKLEAALQKLRGSSTIEIIQGNDRLTKQHPEVAAFVDGLVITNQQVRNACIRRFGSGHVRDLINLTIITSQVPLQDMTINSHEIANTASLFKRGDFPQTDDLRKWFDTSLMVQVYPTALLRKLTPDDSIEVTDQEIRRAYTTDYGVRANVLAIVTDTAAQAVEAWQIAKQNPVEAHFRETSQRFSTDPKVKENAGTIPMIRKHGDKPILEPHAFDLRHGQFSDVVEVDGKFYVLFSLGLYHPDERPEFESVRPKLLAKVRQNKLPDAMFKTFQELKEKATIIRHPGDIDVLLNAPVPGAVEQKNAASDPGNKETNKPRVGDQKQAEFYKLQNEVFRERVAAERLLLDGSTSEALEKIKELRNKVKSSSADDKAVQPLLTMLDRDLESVKRFAKRGGVPGKQKQDPEKLVSVTYGIADLISPNYQTANLRMKWADEKWTAMTFARNIVAGKVEDQAAANSASAKPIEGLIKDTIFPDTWQTKDGNGLGTITFIEQQLSLIVTHKRSIHNEIEDLLEKLRELDVVTIESKGFLVFGKRTEIEKQMRNSGEQLPDMSKSNSTVIKHRQSKYLRGVAASKKEIGLIDLPNSTAFNGQIIELELESIADLKKFKTQFVSVIAPNRESLRTGLTAIKNSGETELQIAIASKSGQSAIINLSSLSNDPKKDMILLVWRPIVVVED